MDTFHYDWMPCVTTMILAHKRKEVSLRALNLVVGMYLQPYVHYNMEKVYIIDTYNKDTNNHRRYL